MFLLTLGLSILCYVSVFAASVDSESRIVGGDIVESEEFPWQVSIVEKGDHVCGGSLVEPCYVVTAAHCLDDSKKIDLKVRSGSNKLNKGGVLKDVSDFKIHPMYNKDTMGFDVAVIKLNSCFVETPKTKPIKLAANPLQGGESGMVSGFGLTENNGRELSPELKATTLKVLLREKCLEKYGLKKQDISESMFCAVGDGTDACEGDSGGPFVTNNELSGIVSFGIECASKKYPGVFTLVSRVLKFISDYIKSTK